MTDEELEYYQDILHDLTGGRWEFMTPQELTPYHLDALEMTAEEFYA